MQPIIKTKNLNFIYNKGKDNEFQALTNISIEIYPQEFIIFFGPSGCGKSTLLNIMAGLEIPDSGMVFVYGNDVAKMSSREFVNYHRTKVGMIYQAYNLITSLSVLDNVALPQIFLNIKKKERNKKALQLLERFGIREHANKIPTELSGGQQQRIGIARAIINNPDIILADEPVGNLDSVSAENVLNILKNLNEKEKKTVILVTHNPEYLEYGDRIMHMKDGMIIRETINKNKYKKKNLAKAPTAELQDMLRAYQGLSPNQINVLIMPYKAKVFAHHFITNRNIEETKIFEDAIQRKLLNTITPEEFFDILHRPYSEGGVGFDKRTAQKIIKRINEAIKMAYFIYQKAHQRKNAQGRHDKITLKEKTSKLTDYLLHVCYEKYYTHLNAVQINRLRRAVEDRLLNHINKIEFYNFLDLPVKEGGVGLNSKTARAITEEIELILILGYGITPNLDNNRFSHQITN